VTYRRRVLLAALIVAIAGIVVWRRHGTASSPHAAGTGSAAKAIATHAVPQRALPARRIAGVVLLDDAPAPSVQVRTAGAAPVVSDAGGHFDLGVQRIARHVVVAEPPNVIGVAAAINLADPTVDAEHVVLALHACTSTLHGLVRDAAGGPIAHAAGCCQRIGRLGDRHRRCARGPVHTARADRGASTRIGRAADARAWRQAAERLAHPRAALT
jgi:hypothetical protein